MRVRVQRLPAAHGLPLPASASPGSAGLDLRAAVEEEVVLRPGERALIPTGLVLEIPPGWEGQVRPRSGLALRHGIGLLNSPGTKSPFPVRRGDRIAQLVFARTEPIEWEESETLVETARGGGGFGSTGVG